MNTEAPNWIPDRLIDVTQENIKHGKCRDPRACMIVEAIKDSFGSYAQVVASTAFGDRFVGYPRFLINNQTYSAHPSVAELMKAFDKGVKVHPFSFTLYKLYI